MQSTGPSKDKQESHPPLVEVTLRFKIEKELNEVYVIIVDKSSGRIIRSIPPEELGQLQEGELIELFA
jgi:uncharacterized FlaG/YvyC family protein